MNLNSIWMNANADRFFFCFLKLLRHLSTQHFSFILMRWHMRNIKQHSHYSWLVKLAKAHFCESATNCLYFFRSTRCSLIFNLQSGGMETVTLEQTRTGSLMLTLHSVEFIFKEFSCLITCCHVSICWKRFATLFFVEQGAINSTFLIHSKNIVFCTFANFMCRWGAKREWCQREIAWLITIRRFWIVNKLQVTS